MVLFQSRGRASEKVHKIGNPESEYASHFNAAPPTRTRRYSTTSAATGAMTTATMTTLPGKYRTHDAPKVMPSSAQESLMANANNKIHRGGSSYKYSNVSSVPAKTTYEDAPKPGKRSSLPRPSAMSRKYSEAGDGSSRTNPRKSVNFAPDALASKRHVDGYSTDAGSSVIRPWPVMHRDNEPTESKNAEPKKVDTPPRCTTRRGLRPCESPPMEIPTACWTLNVTIGNQTDATKVLDGYATDKDFHSRPPMKQGYGGRGVLATPHPKLNRPTLGPSPRQENSHQRDSQRRSPPRTLDRPPGLHSKLLADASGRPPLRFNLVFPPSTPYLKTWDEIPRIIDDELLQEPATEVDLKAMAVQLMCGPLLPWECVIRRREAITCLDVFETIFKEYDVPLTEEELAKIPEHYKSFYQKAFQKRCKQVPVLTALEESRGLKRIDLLAGKSFFRGMTKPDPNGPWVVELQPPPRGYSI